MHTHRRAANDDHHGRRDPGQRLCTEQSVVRTALEPVGQTPALAGQLGGQHVDFLD